MATHNVKAINAELSVIVSSKILSSQWKQNLIIYSEIKYNFKKARTMLMNDF